MQHPQIHVDALFVFILGINKGGLKKREDSLAILSFFVQKSNKYLDKIAE